MATSETQGTFGAGGHSEEMEATLEAFEKAKNQSMDPEARLICQALIAGMLMTSWESTSETAMSNAISAADALLKKLDRTEGK